MELSDKDLKRYGITNQQFLYLQKTNIDIQFFINTFEKNIINLRNKKLKKLKDKLNGTN